MTNFILTSPGIRSHAIGLALKLYKDADEVKTIDELLELAKEIYEWLIEEPNE